MNWTGYLIEKVPEDCNFDNQFNEIKVNANMKIMH